MSTEVEFREACAECELPFSDEQLARSSAYLTVLRRWNRRLSLTSVADDRELIRLHLVEAFWAAQRFFGEGPVVDIGSGAGFPGLAAKLYRPECRVTLLETNFKKCVFLETAARELGLEVTIVHGAAEAWPGWSDARLATIASHGAGLTINSATTDFKSLKKQVQSQAKDWGCPKFGTKIFECSGHTGGQETAFGLLTYASTLMVVGFTLGKLELRLSNLMAFDATAQGTWGCVPALYPDALRLVTDGKITLRPFIATYPMSHGPEVVRQVADHEIDRRAILVPDWSE